ncbi:MAG TPA: DUF5704 domain-containing protein [Clostridia bacterium]|nr:DUF5704 domain-containing protein [Clostridia bacterium]
MTRNKVAVSLSFIILISLLLNSIVLSAENIKFPQDKVTTNFLAVPDKYLGLLIERKIQLHNNEDPGRPMNWYLYTINKYKVVAYGNPAAASGSDFYPDPKGYMWNSSLGQWGEYRYLGWDLTGNKMTNDYYHGNKSTTSTLFTEDYKYRRWGSDVVLLRNADDSAKTWNNLDTYYPQKYQGKSFISMIRETSFFDDDHPTKQLSETGYTLNSLLDELKKEPAGLNYFDIFYVQSIREEGSNYNISVRFDWKTVKPDSGEVYSTYNTVNVKFAIKPPDPTPTDDDHFVTTPPPPPAPGDATGKLRADDRDSGEQFDVDKGIPTKEKLYANVFTPEYLQEYAYHKESGTKSYYITVRQKITPRWEVDNGGNVPCSVCGGDGKVPDPNAVDPSESGNSGSDPSEEGPGGTAGSGETATISCSSCGGDGQVYESDWETETDDPYTLTQSYNVSRNYSFYMIDSLAIYEIVSAEVNNKVLNGEKTVIDVNLAKYNKPVINELEHSDAISDHMSDPLQEAINNDKITNSDGIYYVDLKDTFQDGGRRGKPDQLTSASWSTHAEDAIGKIRVKNDLLKFNKNIIMPNTEVEENAPAAVNIPNSPDIGKDVLYKKDIPMVETTRNGEYLSSGTVLYRSLEKKVGTASDAEKRKPVVGINSVAVHTPVVCNSEVSDEYDYCQELREKKYDHSDLILGRDSLILFQTEGIAHRNIPGYGTRDYTKYVKSKYVQFPFDVYIENTAEDMVFVGGNEWHQISTAQEQIGIQVPVWVDEGEYTVKFKVIACNAPDDINKQENLANKSMDNYIAYSDHRVRVSGQLYGFRITDIEDYPLWETVFRQRTGSAKHNGNKYVVGNNSEPFNLPIMEGSHPKQKDRGALKTGYGFKFEFNTIGNYFGANDYIRITPEFYFVKKDGTERQKVDIYYNERFNSKDNYLVRIGSDKDKLNKKIVTNTDIYRNMPDADIQRTSELLGISEKSFKGRKVDIGNYSEVLLKKDMRLFIGDAVSHPSSVDDDRVAESIQRWYGEYSLPDELFVAPAGYAVASDPEAQDGVDGKESFWLKEGYIIVNFGIDTIQDNDSAKPVLGYWNGNYNRWRAEGFEYTKTDYYGKTFNLNNGDVVFYYANKKSSDDYKVGGNR